MKQIVLCHYKFYTNQWGLFLIKYNFGVMQGTNHIMRLDGLMINSLMTRVESAEYKW